MWAWQERTQPRFFEWLMGLLGKLLLAGILAVVGFDRCYKVTGKVEIDGQLQVDWPLLPLAAADSTDSAER